MSVLTWMLGGGSALLVGGAIGWLTATTGAVSRSLGSGSQSIQVGAWTTSLATGGADADMFTRANVARTGLLALNRRETLYFSATHDDAGRPLEARCEYDVVGASVRSKWWSLTVYADDHFLVPDPSNRYSISVRDVDATGQFKLRVGPRQRDGLWLPTGQSTKGFSLLLRLYNPAEAIVKDPAATKLPTITRVGECR